MILNLIRVSQSDLDSYLLEPDNFEIKINKEETYTTDCFLELDKAWDAVQFAITGSGIANMGEKSPLSRTLFSEQFLDAEQDLGYGPAHYLTEHQVKETNIELQKLDLIQLKESIDLNEMVQENVYPGGWTDDGAKDYLFDYLDDLLKFYQSASNNNEAILTYMT